MNWKDLKAQDLTADAVFVIRDKGSNDNAFIAHYEAATERFYGLFGRRERTAFLRTYAQAQALKI
jgi:hypothetical protein